MFDTPPNITFPCLATPENAIVAPGRRGEATKVASHGSHAPGDTGWLLLSIEGFARNGKIMGKVI